MVVCLFKIPLTPLIGVLFKNIGYFVIISMLSEVYISPKFLSVGVSGMNVEYVMVVPMVVAQFFIGNHYLPVLLHWTLTLIISVA